MVFYGSEWGRQGLARPITPAGRVLASAQKGGADLGSLRAQTIQAMANAKAVMPNRMIRPLGRVSSQDAKGSLPYIKAAMIPAPQRIERWSQLQAPVRGRCTPRGLHSRFSCRRNPLGVNSRSPFVVL